MAIGPISVGSVPDSYNLPTASSTVLGGVKTGDGIENNGGVISPEYRNRGKAADLNDAKSKGWYAFTDNTPNAPVTSSGIVQVLSADGYIWPIQAAYVNGNAIFIRTYNGSSWSAWTNINSWRGVQNSLTSDSTTDSLSAAMGKALKTLVDSKAASGHTHSKSDVGLGNVDNTADSTKSVSYANSAGSAGSAAIAAQLGRSGDVSAPMIFKWEGQTGQPGFIFGSNDGSTFQAYNPANFRVSYADGSGIATRLASAGNVETPMVFSWDGKEGQPYWLWGCDEREHSYVYNPRTFHVAYADSAGSAGNLPYTITLEGARAGTSVDVSELAPITYTFSKEYSAVGFLRSTSYATAYDRLQQLWDMVGSTGFSENFIPMSALSTDFTPLSSIDNCAIDGATKNATQARQIWLRKNGTSIQIYSHHDQAYNLDKAGYVYYYYGINFLPY